ncbi:MAG: hypothetical protein Q4B94_07985 [Pseudomonadota bacterium]|nr:hypothetical protein [Pseudomonadota bacterium]
MSDEKDNPLMHGAWGTAIFSFFATWVAAVVAFNFFGLVFGWIPALLVAVVLYFTAPFLYAFIWVTFFVILVSLLVICAILYFMGL